MIVVDTLSPNLSDFIVDTEDGLYDDSLHQAAWRGDVQELERLLSEDTHDIDLQLRPFYATPLRLAAVNSHSECVLLLLNHGSSVNLADRKGQTPLFCAIKNSDTDSCVMLLHRGASPDGDRKNLSTPLYIACQDGYAVGVKLLLDFGAEIEWLDTSPQWLHPLHVAATYQHLNCFILLLVGGADVQLSGHILHVICNRKCHSTFVHLWVQFGGNLWDINEKGQLAADLPNNPHRALLNELMGTPLALKSLCRMKIRTLLGRQRLPLISTLEIPHILQDFLEYKDISEVNNCVCATNLEIQKTIRRWQ